MDSNNPYAAPSSVAPHPGFPAQAVVGASQGKRFANLLIDYIATSVISFVGGLVVGVIFAGSADQSELTLIGYGVGFACYFAYHIIMEGTTGRTLGKYVTGTKVVDANGNPPTWGAVTLRTLCRLIPFEPFSFFGKEARGWHDSLTKTWVINSR